MILLIDSYCSPRIDFETHCIQPEDGNAIARLISQRKALSIENYTNQMRKDLTR